MSYANVADHRSMVFDTIRNSAYARAIRERVGPDSVVLDLGAGLGVLGLLAAAAGARRVYLVEPEPVVQVARAIALANGLADRIVVLEGRIEDLELPEQVDLILSVFTGNLLYSEDLLPSLFHARDRWLKPGGTLLPDRAELLLAPLCAPDLHAKNVGRWSEPDLGLDYSVVRRFAENNILWLSRNEIPGDLLAPGSVLSAPDFMTATQADCLGTATATAGSSGLCHGLLGWIRIRLGNEWLSTGLDAPELHWMNAVLPLGPPLPLVAGETLTMKLQRPAKGDWTWSMQAAAGTRRHSTFLAHLHNSQKLGRTTADYRPLANDKGAAARFVLNAMDGKASNKELAARLAAAFPQRFADEAAALEFVCGLSVSYGGGVERAGADRTPEQE